MPLNKMSRKQIFALVKEYLPNQKLTGKGITLQYLIKQLENTGVHIIQYEEYVPTRGEYEHELPEIALNILLKVADEDLPSFCSTNKTYYHVCASNEFWRLKLSALLDYDFARTNRNYHEIYDQLKDKNINERLIESAENGYSDLVELLLDQGANIHASDDLAITYTRAVPDPTSPSITR